MGPTVDTVTTAGKASPPDARTVQLEKKRKEMKGGGSSRKRIEQQQQLALVEKIPPPPPVSIDDGEEEDKDKEMYEEEEQEDEDNLVEAEEEEEEQRPKLAEGFFEIEAVRGKRTRKGKRQYLIKWRGWPETANTWEPFDNLQSCSDIIQAFEQRSAKTSRKRKRKHNNNSPTLSKKKQHRPSSTSPTTQPNHNTLCNSNPPYDGVETGKSAESSDYMVDKDEEHGNHGVEDNVMTVYRPTENGVTKVDISANENQNNETNDAEPDFAKLGVLLPPNGVDTGNISIQVPDTRSLGNDGVASEQLKAETSGRCIGAKRRKSGRVTRFKQDSVLAVLDETQPSIPRTTNESGHTSQIFKHLVDDAHEVDYLENPSAIIKIIKPVRYSTSLSNNVHDVSLIFRARRSDGGEIDVDNKYLKLHNPLLLINFYEQHLRYTPPPPYMIQHE